MNPETEAMWRSICGGESMVVISLGWGVQSFTLAAMSALGELPKVDFAIHSDTTHERSATYAFAKKWTPWLKARGVQVVTVNDTRQAAKVFTSKTDIPAFTATLSENGGMLRRQCTQRWKIAPMRRWFNEHGIRQIKQWIGISWDESQRMKPSDVKYITHRWPLIEKRMTRQDCINWLLAHDLEVPIKSSCVFCPFHNKASWRELRLSGNGDWQKAVEVDEAIRKARPPYDLFVHPSRRPLREAGEDIDAQPSFFDMEGEECGGFCFV